MVNLTFLVQDTKNGSAILSPNIQLCRCVNGECFVPEATSEQEAAIENTFLVMSCNCLFGYTGEFCGEVRDFCAGELTPPCNPLVTCANSAAGFMCGNCPNGYEGNGQICSDIDECQGNQTVCDQICTNTVSSYFCGCNDGFSLDSDERTCSDIDECSKPNNCSQLCNNTVGSYECYCRIGFLINSDNPTTCTAKVQCDANNGCDQICYIDPIQVGQEKCACNIGYSLQESDMKSCDDINECQSTQDNLCDQTCTNTVGSYTCSCLEGYSFTSPSTCTDINECLTGDFVCNGVGEECENIPGSYRCACSKRLNMVRVNGTCIFREDESIVADLAPAAPSATQEQTDNAIQITLANFQEVNYTVEANVLFKDSVVKLLNDFCNENTLRPQDCGVEQNQLFFSELNVKRLPSYPSNQGNDAIIQFYVDYPSIIRNATVDQAILASIVFAELQKLRDLTGFSITLDTSVTPPSPGTPTATQSANAVQLLISSFSTSQWTTFYDTVFRRAVVVTLNRFCEVDTYSRTEDCGLSDSQSFVLDNIARLPNNPIQSGENVQVSFYVNHPSNTNPVVLQNVLASMLVIRESDLESALSQQVQIQTSAAPATPPTATSGQTTNSVVIRISSFDANRWTYLNDRRLRSSIASRVASYCSGHLVDCQIQTGGTASFTEANVQRTSSATPSDVGGNSVDYSFYVKYPSGETPIIQYILASVVKIELDAMQSESTLFFSLQTSFQPPPPTTPNSDQSNNTVSIKIRNQQADQWHGIQDNQLRAAIATQIASYCTSNLVTCGVTSDQVSFDSSHVTRIESSPVQDGDNVTYTFFVNYPSGSGPIQRNLLAGILTAQTVAIETATNLSLSVETSTLAATPPVASSDQMSKAIIVSASNIQANQWSAVQDSKFRGYVAQAIAEYCQASVSQTQECELPANQATFTTSHVQLVPGSPSQDGGNVSIQLYVDYPGGGTMSQAILLLIVNQKLTSIATNTGLQLTVVTVIVIPTAPPPSQENTDNAINVVLKDFQADQWSLRDTLFRQNMAEEIRAFCNMSTYHRDICNIS
ncbi:mucin, partial [Paramuricea clavata]